MACDSLASLAKTIEEIPIHHPNWYSLPGYQEIQSIHRHSTSLLPLLHHSPNETISLERRMREIANKAEDAIQLFISGTNRSHSGSIKSSVGRCSTVKFKRQMREVADEMKSIHGEMKMKIMKMKMKDSVTIKDPPSVNSSSPFAPPIARNDMVFGFDNDLVRIKDRLIGGSINLKIVPIVGTGGIGKTALARNACYDPSIIAHFDVHAWVTVSQDYNLDDILRSLLVSLGDKREQKIVDNIESMVRLKLFDKRYLIVMDDVWSGKVWDDVRSIFIDDHTGSRIMLTTRQLDVAAYFDPDSPPHEMKLMDEDRSWCLLWNKVFGEQGCPHEYTPIGKKIARGCGGLPVSIVIMANLLSSIVMALDSWEAIAEDVISAIYIKDGQLEKIISSSFMDLPHHLRLCLLYMGGFPKDNEFQVSVLIKLWIAEGFVKPNGHETIEEVAEGYVQNLVNRSLVMVARRKHSGKIKSCSLQNVVQDFCMWKVQEEKFLLPVKDYLPNTTLRRYFLPQILKNQRRIILDPYDLHLRETIHNSQMRTIICIQQGGYWSMGSVENFPLLRVLHVMNKSDNMVWECDHVFELFHLRYIASNILSLRVPAAISNLQNLQTLIIYRHNVRLPEEIWRLTQLRHLIAFSFHPLPHPELATYPLQNLHTLSLASNFECSELIMKIIPNLRKLGICYSEDTFAQDYHFNNLRNLHQLRKLKLEAHKNLFSLQKLNPVFPVMLKKLSLSGCGLPWKDMMIIGSLPHLEVLKLRDFAFQGDKWETTKGEFRSLQYLLIDKSNLQSWVCNDTHFPRLKLLLLYHCLCLHEIPYEIGFIPTLELIEVDDQNGSLVVSAKMILDEQQCHGNYSLQVQVKHF